ncbi:MAG TPA: DUF2147 domain-containing protein [Candidatus Hydrogenedentes bacterium]|nr:DUF2147 domain-containing protein [Candidatus Hydrogenedentota bacterium]
MRWTIFLTALAACCLFQPLLNADDSDGIVGVWITHGGDVRVEITKAANGTYQGAIVWMEKPEYGSDEEETGKPRHDKNNPDKAKQSRPLMGLNVLEGFKYDKGNVWKGGLVYDPDNGKTYKCTLTLVDQNNLDVRGFIGISLIGRTEHWPRYVPPQEKK